MTTDATAPPASTPNPGEGTTAASTPGIAPQSPEGKAPEGGEGQGPDTTASTEAKPDDKAGKEGDPPEKPAEPEGAPESYEAFTLPEGFTLEGERLKDVQEFAKANNWTQAQTQAAVDKFCTTITDSLAANHTSTVEGWAKQLKEDPEFGGTNFEANLTVAGQAVARFGGQPLIELLNEYGIGNHPVLNKTFLAIGKAISEGGLPGMGSGPPATPQTLADRMYPGMKPK